MYRLIFLLTPLILTAASKNHFFAERRGDLAQYQNAPKAIAITSPGRSGSTLLFNAVIDSANPKESVIKTHLLPFSWRGKILFIFSNPDLAAESTQHILLKNSPFMYKHFLHVEGSDILWFLKSGRKSQQTVDNSLLTYDALNITNQLRCWLHTKVIPSPQSEATILAIKFENLWDDDVVEDIRLFLNHPHFTLPPQKSRGITLKDLKEKERNIRLKNNIGTPEHPIYPAYDRAREIWQEAAPLTYLKISL